MRSIMPTTAAFAAVAVILAESALSAAFAPGAAATFAHSILSRRSGSRHDRLRGGSAVTTAAGRMIRPYALRMSDSGRGGGVGGGADADLVGALARLDRNWELARQSRPYGEWQKIVVGELPPRDPSSSSSPRLEDFFGPPLDGKPRKRFVYLLEPEPPSTPSCVLLFLGGAALGQYPHIAYSELLKRVARRLNAAVVAAPYDLGLNHFDLAKETAESLRQAVIKLEDEQGYREGLPKFLLTHSLGGKLGAISLAATGMGDELAGVGFMSYNNFGVKDIVRQSRSFAKEMGVAGAFGGTPAGGQGLGGQGDMFDGILDFAEMAVGMAGIEFSPSPTDTDRMVSLKYDAELQLKTRLFVFDEDDLDSSREFVNSCHEHSCHEGEGGGDGPSVSELPGSHLAPVYLKLGVDDLDLPEEARDIADGFTGGFRGASFGDEENLNEAVEEICGWVLGKPPSRGPAWEGSQEDNNMWQGPRRLTGGVVDADVES